jgi:hypothetical protein
MKDKVPSRYSENHNSDIFYYSEDFLDIFYYKYLQKIIKSCQLLKEKHIKQIFLMALKDFLEDRISLNVFSSVSCELYYELSKPHEVDIYYEKDLAKALFDATEISYYYSHQDEDPSNKKIYEAQIKNLKEYYEKNKHLLKDFPLDS